MLEKALTGKPRYWVWIACLAAAAGAGVFTWAYQLSSDSESTGLGRDVPWGAFIANYTFMVGVAASAVMVVLPYYLHDYKRFGRITVLGEFIAVAAVAVAILFIMADLGQPQRALNLALHPTPGSPFFWNMVLLNGYLLLNLALGWLGLDAERNHIPASKWVRIVSIFSIPWAVSIHTLTSFVYAGLIAHPFWNTAIMGPRFLASAFAAGPALLILLCMLVRRVSRFDPGREAIQKVATIVCYAMIVDIFFILMEFFSAFYGGSAEHTASLRYLWIGLDGHRMMVPLMWTSAVLGVSGVVILLVPALRRTEGWLALACGAIFIATWIDKGMGLIVGGFAVSPMGRINDYVPTLSEIIISIGIYAAGALILTVLYKIAVAVKEAEIPQAPSDQRAEVLAAPLRPETELREMGRV
ncbi:MAG: polysulfide reductase NrfD [bacterium]|nr:polysulfide reductase NrfD [bacterium]